MTGRAVRVLIEGRVQGVWFRGSTKETADALGVTGWVRNLPDGRVEAFAEGDEQALARFVAWCERGPELARVTNVETRWGDPEGHVRFAVTR